MYPGGNFVEFRLPEGQIGQGTSTERSSSKINAEDGLELRMFIFNDAVGKTVFPGECFSGVFQTPGLDGPPRRRQF